MREVHRRTEIARTWVLCLALLPGPLLLVALLVGATWTAATTGAAVAGSGAALSTLLLRIEHDEQQPGDRLAEAGATRRKAAVQIAVTFGVAAVPLAALLASSSDVWWLLPCFTVELLLGMLGAWWRLHRYERRHPGAIAVSELSWWRPATFVWHEGAATAQGR